MKIYRLIYNQDQVRCAQISTRRPRTYLDIGHNQNGSQPWVLDNDDIKKGPPNSTHGYWSDKIFMKHHVVGRINHQDKQISVAFISTGDPEVLEEVEYAESLLKMEFPDYKIHRFEM